MQTKRFQRTTEDFTCEHCGYSVQGSGYTNHCPKCLWSKHVDVNPGDRAADCHGLMMPVGIDTTGGSYVILHKCARCKHEKRNKTAADDDFEMLLKLSNGPLP